MALHIYNNEIISNKIDQWNLKYGWTPESIWLHWNDGIWQVFENHISDWLWGDLNKYNRL